ncbi:hypothetical protein ACIBKX_09170 [Streptomyces sp. NPDC050658]|uniref:hypothetical protein n=1 Tax=unclassified Streptomyces TaxID=2593676 RepID=UPI003438E7C8
MREDASGSAASYARTARARLVAAYAAYELADLARTAVPVGAHELCPDGTVHSPGAVLAEAAQLLRSARQLLEDAAVFERVGGASWQLVGDVLGVSAQSARVRFAPAEDLFRQDSDCARGAASWWSAYLAEAPQEAARDLDDWVLRHMDGDGDGLGAEPVSGGLARRSPKRGS